jgi:hypothetical protein
LASYGPLSGRILAAELIIRVPCPQDCQPHRTLKPCAHAIATPSSPGVIAGSASVQPPRPRPGKPRSHVVSRHHRLPRSNRGVLRGTTTYRTAISIYVALEVPFLCQNNNCVWFRFRSPLCLLLIRDKRSRVLFRVNHVHTKPGLATPTARPRRTPRSLSTQSSDAHPRSSGKMLHPRCIDRTARVGTPLRLIREASYAGGGSGKESGVPTKRNYVYLVISSQSSPV